MNVRDQVRIMTEEEKQKERRLLEERAEWEWEGRRPYVAENDNSPFQV